MPSNGKQESAKTIVSRRFFLAAGSAALSADQTGEMVKSAAVQWRSFVLDQRDLPALRTAAEKTNTEFGHIDILFANTGIQVFRPLLQMEERKSFETHYVECWCPRALRRDADSMSYMSLKTKDSFTLTRSGKVKMPSIVT
jgi:NAD(P)-dependent dehydrogenase (short-subunit alcohol dehydrogenase family)